MTAHALMTLIAFSLLKGALFGILFAWMFPPLHRYLLARTGRDAGPLRQAGFGGRLYWGLAVLSGAGFALIDLVDRVSEAAGLPGLLFWAVIALFGLTACGTVLIVSAMPRGEAGGTSRGRFDRRRPHAAGIAAPITTRRPKPPHRARAAASSTSLSVATKPIDWPARLASVSASACSLDQRTLVNGRGVRGRRRAPTSQ